MAANSELFDLSAYPVELIRAAAEEGARDADNVHRFLGYLGLTPPPGGVRYFPRPFLLNLAAALRLVCWEAASIDVHLKAGLPRALEALKRVTLEAADKNSPLRQDAWLARAVFMLTVERFAWAGPRELKADVLLEVPDEATLVRAMADFLWRHRTQPGVGGPVS
jgi:hypothetical protein